MLDAPKKTRRLAFDAAEDMQVVDTARTPPSCKLGFLLLFSLCFLLVKSKIARP